MSDKAQMVLVGIHGDDLLDGYERLKKERDDALTRIAELEGARAKAMGKPVAGFLRDEEWLREVNCEVVGQDESATVEAIGYALEELDRRATVIAANASELKDVERTSRRLGFEDGHDAAIREHAHELFEELPAVRAELEGARAGLSRMTEDRDQWKADHTEVCRLNHAQAAELGRLRAFRANAQQVASDIGCEGWDKVGKCDCPGCRIWKADWDDEQLDRAPAQAEPQAEFHAQGNPPREVMALVQREYRRMGLDKQPQTKHRPADREGGTRR